jgi:ABC-type Na+ efflux pump permease subunit
MPLELAITLGGFAFYLGRTRGPAGPPAILLVTMLLLQAIIWFAPHPASAGLFLYLQALIAFGVLTALAAWVGENRWFRKRGGLAMSGM